MSAPASVIPNPFSPACPPPLTHTPASPPTASYLWRHVVQCAQSCDWTLQQVVHSKTKVCNTAQHSTACQSWTQQAYCAANTAQRTPKTVNCCYIHVYRQLLPQQQQRRSSNKAAAAAAMAPTTKAIVTDATTPTITQRSNSPASLSTLFAANSVFSGLVSL